MKTANDIIGEIQELSLDERQKVIDYLSADDGKFTETCYSKEIIEEIDRDIEEAERGINVSPAFETASEAIAYLHQFRKV